MNPRLPILGALALALVPARAADMTTDKAAPPSRIAGTWDVAYEDLALGEVDGTATVEPDGQQVKVELVEPGTGRKLLLTSESVTQKGDDYTIVLVGESPSSPALMPDGKTASQGSDAQAALLASPPAPRVQLPSAAPPGAGSTPPTPAPMRIEVPPSAGKLEVHVADFNGEVILKPRHGVDRDRVELSLHFRKVGGPYDSKSENQLAGTWRFFADPVTWRDSAGRGRVGYFRREPANPNLATQSAAEVWSVGTPPARLQLFAIGVFDWKKITRLYLGVPTLVEAIFDEPQDNDTCTIELQVGGRTQALTAHRDPGNWTRFLSDPFIPGTEPRPPPPPTAPSQPAPKPSADDDETPHAPFSP